MTGPLSGIRVVELAGIGPGPFTTMMLADMGADVIRVDRPEQVRPERFGTPHPDVLNRGRRSIAVDLKHPAGRAVVLDLVRHADVLVEGFRPGVAERLRLGPDDCLAVNPRLVYGRMTGWGQDGPNAAHAGHDIDYLALTGALYGIGRAGTPPVPPLNLVGDFGGGGMLLAFGVVCALLSVRAGGGGQVIDAAMVDGVSLLSTAIHGLRGLGMWRDERGANLLDGGAPFYDTYECADGRYLAVGALEPQFYDELVRLTGFEEPDGDDDNDRDDHDDNDRDDNDRDDHDGDNDRDDDNDRDGGNDRDGDDGNGPASDRFDPAGWPAARRAWARLFRSRTRDEWAALLEHSDACVAPVLDWREAPQHPHLAARHTFVEYAGVTQPAPAPRFSATPGAIRRPPPQPGEHTDEVLRELGRDPAALRAERAVA